MIRSGVLAEEELRLRNQEASKLKFSSSEDLGVVLCEIENVSWA